MVNAASTAEPGAGMLMAVLMYMGCSVTMVLTNKALAMLPAWRAQELVLLPVAMQNASALLLLLVYESSGKPSLVRHVLPRLWPGQRRALNCLPCSVAFVAMILTSFFALAGVSVPFVTVGKNASNMLTAIGEWHFFGKTPSSGKALALVLMVMGAFAAAWNDLAFSLAPYMWLLLNCVATSAYALMMRVLSVGGKDLPDRVSTLALNNAFSLVLILAVAMAKGELSPSIFRDHFWELFTPGAMLLHGLAGAVAFFLNFATMRCVAATSATTYAMIGAVNKLPTALIGYALWRVPMSQDGMICIGVGLFSTLLYAMQ